MTHDRQPVGFADVLDIVRRFDQRKKSTVKLGYTQEAGNPRAPILVSLDARGPDGAATEVRAINATGSFIGAGVRVQVRYDRPARAAIECIVSDMSGDDRNAWEPRWEVLGGTTPSVGNGELIGRYQIISGRFFFEMSLYGGSTTAWGSAGNLWLFTLPDGIVPTPSSALLSAGPGVSNVVWLGYDASVPQRYHGFGHINLGPHIILVTQTTTSAMAAFVANSQPFTWTTDDILVVTGDFPIAGV